MKTLAERLNFSFEDSTCDSIVIDRAKDINYYDTFCKYCADNDVNLDNVNDAEFDGAVGVFEDFASYCTGLTLFNFWIDK